MTISFSSAIGSLIPLPVHRRYQVLIGLTLQLRPDSWLQQEWTEAALLTVSLKVFSPRPSLSVVSLIGASEMQTAVYFAQNVELLDRRRYRSQLHRFCAYCSQSVVELSSGISSLPSSTLAHLTAFFAI